MYYEGSIADRLRESQRELNVAHARVQFVHNQLGVAGARIRELEAKNLELTQQLEQLQLNLVSETTEEFKKKKK